MTPSQLMQAMADAGAPMDAIIIALRALEEKDAEIAARDAAAAQKRAKDAERKRAARVHGHSADIPETVRAASEDTSLSLPPNEINSNPPTHTHPVNTPCARKADPFPKPEWADPQVWADWMDVRRAKKARNTPTAYAGFLRSIAEQATDEWPPGRLLAHAVENSWKSIHRPEEPRNGRSNQNLRQSGSQGIDRRSGLARAIDSELARGEVFPFP